MPTIIDSVRPNQLSGFQGVDVRSASTLNITPARAPSNAYADYCKTQMRLPADISDLTLDFDALGIDASPSPVASRRVSLMRSDIDPDRPPSASPSPSKAFSPRDVPDEVPDLSRAQSIRAILNKPNFPHRDLILQRASQMGNIKRLASDKSGVSSGVLIQLDGQDFLLASRHGLPDGDFSVEFTDYQKKPETVFSYSGKALTLAEHDQLNFSLNDKSDFVLVKLNKTKHEFPTTTSMTVGIPKNQSPSTLIHMGFQGGNVLHVSIAETRSVDLIQASEREASLLENQVLVWSQRKTIGVIRQADRQSDGAIHLLVETKSGQHRLQVSDQGVWKVYKNDKVSEIEPPTLEKGMLFGLDHAVVGHKTDKGSSGGIYFSPDDAEVIFGVHRSVLSNDLLDDAHVQYFRNHLIVYPWAEQITDIFKPWEENEGKNDLSKNLDAFVQHAKGRKITIKNIEPALLYVKSIIKTEDKPPKHVLSLSATATGKSIYEMTISPPELVALKKLDDKKAKSVKIKSESITRWMNVGESGVNKVKTGYKDTVQRFENFVKHNMLLMKDVSSGKTNHPVFEGLDVYGHVHNGGVKLYLDFDEMGIKSTERALYTYDSDSRTLNYAGRDSH